MQNNKRRILKKIKYVVSILVLMYQYSLTIFYGQNIINLI
jgi:hypothetical protein